MKYRMIAILSLLFFTAAKAGTPAKPAFAYYNNASHPTPVYVSDGMHLITSEADDARIDNIIRIARDIYPVQIGAFRLKTNADRMYAKVARVLGSDVVMIAEDGYYKIRVTTLNKTKIKSFQELENKQERIQAEVPAMAQSEDTTVADTLFPDTVVVSETYADTIPVYSPAAATEPVAVAQEEPRPRFFLLNNESPWLKKINYFGKSFALVNALIVTIFISVVTMIILLMVILLNRTRMEKMEELKQYLAQTYQAMIIDYLFTGSSPDKFRPIASDTYRRQALIDQMIDVSVNLKGDAEEKLGGLYLYLGLDRDSIKRANDYRWHKKIKGFRELAFMNIKDANPVIYKALNSKNDILRMEAQIALVRLADEDPFDFLFHLEQPFSLWEQITLHELIIQHDIPVPEFRKFLRASNPTVVMFALRMIREFKQKDSEDDVRETLEHPSPEVRRLAVQIAGDLEMYSTLEVMKRMYKSQDYNTCLEIIKALAKMPDPSVMGFLKLVLDKEDDVQLQIEATKAIENNGEEGVKTLVKLMKSEYKNYNIIVRHVLDRRIF
jgi:hypothetical protein